MWLSRSLHFSRNTQNGELVSRNRLNIIQPILANFNSKMEKIYTLSKNFLIYDFMVYMMIFGFMTWVTDFSPNIKNKRHKYCVEMYMLTELWEVIYRIMVYSGQGHNASEDISHTEFMIEQLMDNLLCKGRSLFMVNFCNSVQLTRKLLIKKTCVTGTLRSNQKNYSKDVIG